MKRLCSTIQSSTDRPLPRASLSHTGGKKTILLKKKKGFSSDRGGGIADLEWNLAGSRNV
eukprot:11182-Eustigmatos_ZCMA.PRE.1